MRLLQFAAMCIVVSFQAGCIYSVHPLLHESDLKKDFDLSGEWELQVKNPNKKRGATKLTLEGFAHGATSEYNFTWGDQEFAAQVGKVGDDYYVQVRKLELTPEAPPLLTAVPVYSIAKIKFADGKLEVFKIDETRAVPFMKEIKVPFLHYEPSNGIEFFVLTGTTESLQDLVRKSGEKLFAKTPMIFTRASKLDE